MRGFHVLFLLAVLAAGPVLAADVDVTARDFRADSERAARNGTPIVVMYTSAGCPYCRIVRRYVEPLASDPDWRDRLIVRIVETDSYGKVVDFDGKPIPQMKFADARGVAFTPVLQFLGPDGRELAPDLQGIVSEDFYAIFLEQRIEEAERALRAARPARVSSSR